MAKENIYFLKIWSLDEISDEHLFLSISKNLSKYKALVQMWKPVELKFEEKL